MDTQPIVDIEPLAAHDHVGSGTAVRLTHATKSYGRNLVLKDISFDVPVGQHLVLIGPSGSGKTTILRCLMTLEALDSGKIEIGGAVVDYDQQPIRSARAQARFLRKARRMIGHRVGMVFQQFNLFPNMRVVDNVTTAPIHVLDTPPAVAREEAIELLRMVGLAEKVDAYPMQLSGGQQQRVAIARALAMHPKVMLFDEVTSALDPELVGEVLKVIRALATKGGMTILIVTHEMEFAAEIAHRIIFMEGGRVVEDDSPSVIFGNPRNQRTREFLTALRDR